MRYVAHLRGAEAFAFSIPLRRGESAALRATYTPALRAEMWVGETSAAGKRSGTVEVKVAPQAEDGVVPGQLFFSTQGNVVGVAEEAPAPRADSPETASEEPEGASEGVTASDARTVPPSASTTEYTEDAYVDPCGVSFLESLTLSIDRGQGERETYQAFLWGSGTIPGVLGDAEYPILRFRSQRTGRDLK